MSGPFVICVFCQPKPLPMSTIHLTNGDVAAESLRAALAEASRDDRVHALRDDLAVGPLRGIDDGPDVRAEFWDRVSADTRRDFLREFREQAAALENIARGDANLVVWHGESAADQLMLRRVCYHLRNSPQRLNEVRLSIRDLTDPGAWAHSRKDRATSVGMFAPTVLQGASGRRRADFGVCASAGSHSNGRKPSTRTAKRAAGATTRSRAATSPTWTR